MRFSTYFATVVGILIASSTVVFAADVESPPGEQTADRFDPTLGSSSSTSR